MSSSGWGGSTWGSSSWGGSGVGTLAITASTAHRENVIRVEFSEVVYYSGYDDPPDAGLVTHWDVTAVAGSIGLDGQPARAVRVIAARLAGTADGVALEDVGRFIDLILDRPMSPCPALYDVEATDIYSADLANVVSGDSRLTAVYHLLLTAQADAIVPSRDIANGTSATPDPDDPSVLGAYGYDQGDYAVSQGIEDLKKRVTRRMMTKKGGFVFLPDYGVGLADQGKKLARPAVLTQIVAEGEKQIAQEPDVELARVVVRVDPNAPDLFRVRTVVRPRGGAAALAVDVPVVAG